MTSCVVVHATPLQLFRCTKGSKLETIEVAETAAADANPVVEGSVVGEPAP